MSRIGNRAAASRSSGTGRISDWPATERPRELLESTGAEHLSNAQLLAVLLRTGLPSPPATALDLGRDILVQYPSLGAIDSASFSELRRIPGIGPAKAAAIKAAFEVGRRRMVEGERRGKRFTDSRTVADHFRPKLLPLSKEVFIAVLLNGRNELMREITVSVGCLTSSIVHPREVFQPAIRESAAAVLFVHNHPSGDPTPSQEDRRLTQRLVEAGKVLGIAVIDHVVVAGRGFVSLLEGTSRIGDGDPVEDGPSRKTPGH